MNTASLKRGALLLTAAVIWGAAFVAQSVGMKYVGPFTFNAVRSFLGALTLIPCIFLLDRDREKSGRGPSEDRDRKKRDRRTLLAGGICCGLCLGVASNLQQVGISYTTVGKAGFITALYIVIVPLLGLFLRKKVSIRVWISVALAVAGLYLLCMTEKLSLAKGDYYMIACAFVFAVHILTIDHFSPLTDGVRMSCIQFFVSGLLSSVLMLLFEEPRWSAIWSARIPILYAGILSCGVAYTLQILGQKDMDPTVASLILSLESVVSVLAGWLLLGQTMSLREICGCAVMFTAIILTQLPDKKLAG